MNMLSPDERTHLGADGYIHLARRLKNAEEIQRWTQALREWQPPSKLLRVHLEHNDLTAEHAAQILNAINGPVQAVYLHHNQLRSLQTLDSFLERHSRTLLELHLSHNNLCTLEAEALLLQIGQLPLDSTDSTPSNTCSWIRLEFNCIDVQKLTDRLPRSINRRLQLEDNGCTPTRCRCLNRQHNHRLHSKFLLMQHNAMPNAEDRHGR
ncbi:mdh [Symbiodinium sp. CCMP2592]|nr:mdh [Symbiodinium sp. CCMP2592]